MKKSYEKEKNMEITINFHLMNAINYLIKRVLSCNIIPFSIFPDKNNQFKFSS